MLTSQVKSLPWFLHLSPQLLSQQELVLLSLCLFVHAFLGLIRVSIKMVASDHRTATSLWTMHISDQRPEMLCTLVLPGTSPPQIQLRGLMDTG
ncbi:hypothetical protein Nmel_014291, partial [Mimus melanotis]